MPLPTHLQKAVRGVLTFTTHRFHLTKYFLFLALAFSVLERKAFADDTGSVIGTVSDAQSRQLVSDVVITLSSKKMRGEQIIVSDSNGYYIMMQLLPGEYSIRYEKEGFRPLVRESVLLRAGATLRVNVLLLPESVKAEEIVVVGKPPSVDVGSSSQGVTVNQDTLQRVPFVAPASKNAAQRSFESVGAIVPGASNDGLGVTFNGASSPENQFFIDGLSVNDPGFGTLGTPLAIDFIQEVNVIQSGYMPEFARSTGGIFNVVTKSGSNTFSGSVFSSYTPGILSVQSREIQSQSLSISGRSQLWNVGSLGADLGGPIVKDKLWFYVGFDGSLSRFRVSRYLNEVQLDGMGQQLTNPDGSLITKRIPGTDTHYFADERTLQHVAKLTYRINAQHTLTLETFGVHNGSGGAGLLSMNYRNGTPEVSILDGDYSSLAHRRQNEANDVVLKWKGSFLDSRMLFDATLGWHRQTTFTQGADGSRIGDSTGYASMPGVEYTSTVPHTLRDFIDVPTGYCDAPGTPGVRCPANHYFGGGPGQSLSTTEMHQMKDAIADRYQARLIGTYLFQLLGHHVLKAGVDVEGMRYEARRAFSGGYALREDPSGAGFLVAETGILVAPDTVETAPYQKSLVTSVTAGGFVQDSWNIKDVVTLNLGIRYDGQSITGTDRQLLMNLPNQWSPRVGLVYDFTRSGRSKIFVNYARYFENAPLDGSSLYPAQSLTYRVVQSPPCDPRNNLAACLDPANRVPLVLADAGHLENPNKYYGVVASKKAIVDPNIQPQSQDEFVIGGEYEVWNRLRVGGNFTFRYLNQIIEDGSNDYTATYFVGNPGSGLASSLARAKRNYWAGNIYVQRAFDDGWMAQASYTLSSLWGNYDGLIDQRSGYISPNATNQFDLPDFNTNREGYLTNDVTHRFNFTGSKDFWFSSRFGLTVAGTFRTRSGTPVNYLGAHPLYGQNTIYILPAGSGGRLPWVHNIDAHVRFSVRIAKDNIISLGVSMFNVFNFQQVVAVDETYTLATVRPMPKGTKNDLQNLTLYDGSAFSENLVNPNFKKPLAYQDPMRLSLNIRWTY